MTAFRAVVLEHFRHPRNRGPLEQATASVEGANPLCGDRIRVEVRVVDGTVDDARFTAEQLEKVVAMLDQAGWQIMTHAIGDAAVRMTLDAYEAAAKVNAAPERGRRSFAGRPT